MKAPTPEEIETFKVACLRMEAEGNHGSRGGPGGTVDLRRGIAFWGTGRGWQLRKNWRDVFAKQWPDVELPPRPELPSRLRSIPRKVLDKLAAEYRSFRPEFGHIEYWGIGDVNRDVPVGWRMAVYDESAAPYERERFVYLGGDSHSARDTLVRLIAEWKEEKQITGQEPHLGGQPERTGNEPVIQK